MARRNPYQVVRVNRAESVSQLAELCQRNFDLIEDDLRLLDDVLRLRVVFVNDLSDLVLEPNTLTVIEGAGGNTQTAQLPYTDGNDAALCIVKLQLDANGTVNFVAQSGEEVNGVADMTQTTASRGYIAQAGNHTWGRIQW